MDTARTVVALRAKIRSWRAAGDRIALVPTMGALHQGHLSLVDIGRRRAHRVVASIFVNPMQFGANEDLDRYPRQEARDAELLRKAGCDLLFLPPAEAVYPQGYATTVSVAGLDRPMEGASRPGHFDGVATVVTKLLLMAFPDVAISERRTGSSLPSSAASPLISTSPQRSSARPSSAKPTASR